MIALEDARSLSPVKDDPDAMTKKNKRDLLRKRGNILNVKEVSKNTA